MKKTFLLIITLAFCIGICAQQNPILVEYSDKHPDYYHKFFTTDECIKDGEIHLFSQSNKRLLIASKSKIFSKDSFYIEFRNLNIEGTFCGQLDNCKVYKCFNFVNTTEKKKRKKIPIKFLVPDNEYNIKRNANERLQINSFLIPDSVDLVTNKSYDFEIILKDIDNYENDIVIKDDQIKKESKVIGDRVLYKLSFTPKLYAGNYTGQLLTSDSLHKTPAIQKLKIKIKDNLHLPLVIFGLSAFLGFFVQFFISKEKYILLAKKFEILAEKIPSTPENMLELKNKATKYELECLVGLGTIEFYEARYKEIFDSYIKSQFNVKASSLSLWEKHYHKFYRLLTLLVILLLSFWVFTQLYCENDIFGSKPLVDYLSLASAGLLSTAATKFLLSDAVNLIKAKLP